MLENGRKGMNERKKNWKIDIKRNNRRKCKNNEKRKDTIKINKKKDQEEESENKV